MNGCLAAAPDRTSVTTVHMLTAYLSLGSNLGEREHNLREAIERLKTKGARVEAVSRVYETAPIGDTQEPVPHYLNCVVRLATSLPPNALLQHTQSVERAGGRVPSFHWGPRSIDIDILLYDGVTIETDSLTIPHPRLVERAFVLRPLADVAPDLVLPDGQALRDLLAKPLVQEQNIEPWSPIC